MLTPRQVDIDLVVAGAGAAGLAAALRAGEAGLSVALFEATEHFRGGNNTSMSTSMIPAGGSRWQAAAEIDDSPERFAEDVARKTKGTADPVITCALTGVAPELVAWLADSCNVPLSLVTDFNYPGHSRPRCHSVPDRSGRALLDHLLAAFEQREDVTLAVPMCLEDVELDEDGVTSALVRNGSGAAERIATHAVVLASGGFGADGALVRSYAPEIADALYHGGAGCRGDALRIGERLGADVGYLDAYQGHGSVATPQTIIVTWAVVMHGGVIVNRNGRRFADESQGYSEFARLLLDQPDGTAYEIFDKRVNDLCRPFADYQDLLANGAVHWAEDLGALAAALGVSEEVLGAEFAAVAASAGGGSPGRRARRRPRCRAARRGAARRPLRRWRRRGGNVRPRPVWLPCRQRAAGRPRARLPCRV